MQHLNKLENEENLWKAFKTFDADGSGFITAEELVLALEKYGMSMGKDEVQQMIAEVDSNKDGLINYDEFVAMMRGNEKAGLAPAGHKATKTLKVDML